MYIRSNWWCHVAVLCVLCACVVVAAPEPCAGINDPDMTRICEAVKTFLDKYGDDAAKKVPSNETKVAFEALLRDYPPLQRMLSKPEDVHDPIMHFGRRR